MIQRADTILTDVTIPRVFLSDPERFGGVSDNSFQTGDLVIRDGRCVGLTPSNSRPNDNPRRFVLPGLVEAHCHLDKCFTAERLDFPGGDLVAAIEAQEADKAVWTQDDLLRRAEAGLRELVAAGCRAVRTHVDWGTADDPMAKPLAWEVMRALREAWSDRIDIQFAMLASIEFWADADFARSVAQQAARDRGVIGAYALDQPLRDTGIRNLLAQADRFGLAVDLHADEGLAPEFDNLERMASEVLRTGFEGPVLCGHACSLMERSGAALARTIDLVAEAGISVVSLPGTNLFLQGRGTGTPDRRGITRMRELDAAGVTLAVGTDNVCDAFFPLGRHDPLAALGLAIPAAHLQPPLDRWLPLVTGNAATALGLDPVRVDGGKTTDLLVISADGVGQMLSGGPEQRARLCDLPEVSGTRIGALAPGAS